MEEGSEAFSRGMAAVSIGCGAGSGQGGVVVNWGVGAGASYVSVARNRVTRSQRRWWTGPNLAFPAPPRPPGTETALQRQNSWHAPYGSQ